ncbi:hypothetical protein NP493_193g04030 [Ridgeia piscesae]|uniref:Uncharacterized protein n=1 Tax=Ridgeia piscesae TaxID=27915 RepID=A0AAD9UEP8_RIDPI|nr:hypothetical protein NP493_193g04030 [Ridgeia piscesae]
MEIRFIVLEKAYATISREMAMGTLMWMGSQGEVRLVEGTRRAGSCVDRRCKESPKQNDLKMETVRLGHPKCHPH